MDRTAAERKRSVRRVRENLMHGATSGGWKRDYGMDRHRQMAKAAGKQLLPNTCDYRANRRLYQQIYRWRYGSH